MFLLRGADSDHAGTWCFPGGSVELVESGLEAVRRELQEETGYTQPINPTLRHSATDGSFRFDTFTAAIPEEFEPRLNREHTQAVWAPLDQPPEPLHPGVRESLTAIVAAFPPQATATFADADDAADVAGGDAKVEDLLRSAVSSGRMALASATQSAVERYLKSRNASEFHFTADEKQTFADAIEQACTIADLLGRSRLIRYSELIDRQKGKVAFSANTLDTFAEPPPPMASRRALDYFRRLVPKLGIDPEKYGPMMERHAFTMAAATEETLLERVQKSLSTYLGTDWLERPEGAKSGAQVVQSVLDDVGLTPANPQYGEMVFRTNVMDSYHTGFDRQLAQPEMQEKFPAWQYLGIDDERAGKDHRPHFNRFYPSSMTFDEVRGKRPFNCLLPGQYVQGRFTGGLKTWYAGEVTEIHTHGGRRLTVTANHPVLTPRGFVAAKLLREGDDLIAYRGESEVGVLAIDKQDHPPLIEKVFQSLQILLGGSRRSPVTALDLHGDAAFGDGEVDVVGADRVLADGGDAEASEIIAQEKIAVASVGEVGGQSRGTPALNLEAVNHAAAGLLCGGNLFLATVGGGDPTPLLQLRLGSGSELNIHRDEASRDSRATYPNAVADGLHGLASDVPSGDSIPIKAIRSLGRGSDENTAASQHVDHTPILDAELPGKLLNGFSGRVQSDRIVGINRVRYEGHVYDLETDIGYFVASANSEADGIIISNCRCSRRPVHFTEWKELQGRGAKMEFSAGGTPPDGAGDVLLVAMLQAAADGDEDRLDLLAELASDPGYLADVLDGKQDPDDGDFAADGKGKTGVFEDKRGRRYRLQNGKRVPLGDASGAKEEKKTTAEKSSEKKPTAKPDKAKSKEAVANAIQKIGSGSVMKPGDAEILAAHLKNLTIPELKEHLRTVKFGLTGKKQELVDRLTNWAKYRSENNARNAAVPAAKAWAEPEVMAKVQAYGEAVRPHIEAADRARAAQAKYTAAREAYSAYGRSFIDSGRKPNAEEIKKGQAMAAALKTAEKEHLATRDAIVQEKLQAEAKLFEILKPGSPAKFEVAGSIKGSLEQKYTREIDAAHEFLGKITNWGGSAWRSDLHYQVNLLDNIVDPKTGLTVPGRAHYDNSMKTVAMGQFAATPAEAEGGRTYTASTHVHELGHLIEMRKPEAMKLALEFLSHRCGGESPTKMSDHFPQLDYKPNEMGRKDDFAKAFGGDLNKAYYTGKDYGTHATEVTSMGIQRLYENPVAFHKADPEYFAYVVKILGM